MPTLTPPKLPPPKLTSRQQRAAAARRRTQKVVLAIVASLLLHGLLLLLLGWAVQRWPRQPLPTVHRPPPLKVTILPTTPPPSGPGNTPSPQYIPTDDDQATDEKIENPDFISHQNTRAAAELDASGQKPLPSQEGKQREDFDFKTRPYRPGKEASQAASNPPAQPAVAQTQAEFKTEPEPPKATPKPENQRPPRPTSTPDRVTLSPDGRLALATPEPSTAPAPPSPTPENAAKTAGNTPPQPPRQPAANAQNPSAVASTGLPKLPGYQPQAQQTKMQGSINNRGKSAVQAMGTPLGRYQKAVQDAIGALWYYRIDEKTDVLSVGQVKTHFYVTANGKIRSPNVVSGNPNGALASVSIGAVMDADIPPMSSEVSRLLPNGELELDLTFSFDTY